MMELIGGVEWEVGQIVRVTLPNGEKRVCRITDFRNNRHNGELTAHTNGGIVFIESDVVNNWVEAVE